MFTGLIQEVGLVENLTRQGDLYKLSVKSEKIFQETPCPADSIAVNGVCLTLTSLGKNILNFDLMAVTIKDTNLKRLKKRDKVNLEQALKVGQKLGGHFVLGHVDCEGKIIKINPRQGSYFISITYPAKMAKYIIPKGSIAVDGISLTIQKVFTNYFTVSIIPYTLENTNLKYRRIGDWVNLEFDYLIKAAKQ